MVDELITELGSILSIDNFMNKLSSVFYEVRYDKSWKFQLGIHFYKIYNHFSLAELAEMKTMLTNNKHDSE